MSLLTIIQPVKRPFTHGLTALCIAALAACGGGGISLSGGVGSGGSGVAEGSITGFGSVIVDGVTYEDTNASVVVANAQGTTDLVQAKLGQRVRVNQSQSGVADQILVLPQLRGKATAAADSSGWFQLLGQWVHLITVSDAQNNATVLDGLTTVAAGDALEVHGAWVFDATKNASVLVASRIEKLSINPDPVLISGVVNARSGNTVTVNSANGTKLQYANMPSGIAAQSLISAWVPLSTTTQSTWTATRLVDASPQTNGDQRLVLGTQVTSRDVAQGTVVVQGLSVKLPDSLVSSPPELGATVQLEIVRDGNGWKAVTVTQRKSSSDLGGTVELKGSLVWSGPLTTVNLRDVPVSVSASALDKSCNNISNGSLVYLTIKAQRTTSSQLLQATEVTCNVQTPSNGVIEISGQLVQINADSSGSTGSLVVSGVAGRQTFKWTAVSLLPPALGSLLNRDVEVEYQVVNGENRLRRIKPN